MEDSPETSPASSGLQAHHDARALVRLVQCQVCFIPLRTPVTLPCGNSVCKQCLPSPHARENISYLANPNRQSGITCPFAACGQEHPTEDCSVNVVLARIMELINNEVDACKSTSEHRQTSMEELLYFEPASPPPQASETVKDAEKEKPEKGHSRTLPGGRLLATFAFAKLGELRYTSELTYHDQDDSDADSTQDTALLERIKDVAHKEMECHVCYHLMLNPVTTPCGHTFCRKCLARILDHARLCPVCRRELPLPPSLSRHPNNKVLTDTMTSLCPDQVAAREEAVALEERSAPGGLDTALFVCATAFPSMPTFLHVFEPRYRLMIRRAIEANGQFGIIAYNERGLPQGRGGRTQFMEVGTLLQIENYQFLADGRSFIQCRGVSRFRVLAHGMLDGYLVSRVEQIEDVSLEEEERLEAEETSAPEAEPGDAAAQMDRMPTRELLEIGTNFVQRARSQSASWLHGPIVQAFGEPPDDPALFPYWFASVLPLSDQEKYKLLPTTSIRERCKITARWVHRIQAQRWYHGSACTVL